MRAAGPGIEYEFRALIIAGWTLSEEFKHPKRPTIVSGWNKKQKKKTRQTMMKRQSNTPNRLKWTLALGLAIATLAASGVSAAPPVTQTYFVCPSVSTHNANGMWVIGHHGGYYVLVPKQGGANDGSKVFLTIPVQVANLAEIPAGWALYNSLPSYPNFEGMGMLLAEGIDTWLGNPPGWAEGDVASIVNNGDGTYTVTNLTLSNSITIDHPVPLASAAVW
jgi:hypothetical protein